MYVEYSDLKQKVFACKRVVEVDRNGFRSYLHYLGVDAVAVGIDERHDSSGEEPLFVERTVGGEDVERQVYDIVVATLSVCLGGSKRKLKLIAYTLARKLLFELRQHHTHTVHIFERSLGRSSLHKLERAVAVFYK